TLRGRTLRRNPWVFGALDAHQCLRYTSRHSHFRFVHRRSRGCFPLRRNAPLPMHFDIPQLRQIASRRSSSAQERSISELLLTLSRVAASRQTSWLSLHPCLLYH